MFWNKAARNARRQQVLDELIDVPAEDRRIHLYRAVAEGDVRAREVEQALRLVSRLDALREMEIPTAFGPGKTRTAGAGQGAMTPAEADASNRSPRARRRVAMEVALTSETSPSSSSRAAGLLSRGTLEAIRRPGSGDQGSGTSAPPDDQKPSIAWLRP